MNIYRKIKFFRQRWYKKDCEKIYLFEDHDESLYIWENKSIKNATLIHIDAHHDLYGLWKASESEEISTIPINIGNYLFKAIESEILCKIIWVLPDQTFADIGGIQSILCKLKSITGAKDFTVVGNKKIICGYVFGKKFVACTLDNIPLSNAQVLLDIDVDYFLVRNSTDLTEVNCNKKPWVSPVEMVKRLNEYNFNYSVVTIAYSVNGGYTPLQWKHLGKELKGLLSDEQLAWTAIIQKAYDYAQVGMFRLAIRQCLLAEELDSNQSAIQYYLSRIHLALGNRSEAASRFARAVSLDDSYDTPFAVSGWACIEFGKYEDAFQSFLSAIRIKPDEPYYFLGLGLIFSRCKTETHAINLLRKAIEINPTIIECYRELGTLYLSQVRKYDAMDMLIRSLLLYKFGYRARTDPNAIGHDKTCRNDDWDYSGNEVRKMIQRVRTELQINSSQYYLRVLSITQDLLFKIVLFIVNGWLKRIVDILRFYDKKRAYNKYQFTIQPELENFTMNSAMKLWA